jgi:hypothetical protein
MQTAQQISLQIAAMGPTPYPPRSSVYTTDLDGTVVLLIGGRSFSGALETCSWYAILQVVDMTGVAMFYNKRAWLILSTSTRSKQ